MLISAMHNTNVIKLYSILFIKYFSSYQYLYNLVYKVFSFFILANTI